MILSDEQRMVRDMARNFAEAELAPHATLWDREATFPKEAVSRLGALGLMGMLPPVLGRRGLAHLHQLERTSDGLPVKSRYSAWRCLLHLAHQTKFGAVD